MKKFFRLPPTDTDDFFDLFHVIWDQGIGNVANPDGLRGRKWTRESLSSAFEVRGLSVSERTIDYWHSRKHLPDSTNLRALIDIVSDRSTRSAWQDALLKAARKTRKGRVAEDRSSQESGRGTGRNGGPTEAEDPAEPKSSPLLSSPESIWSRPRKVWVLPAAAVVAIGAIIAWQAQPRVGEIKICDAEHFSVPNQACSRHIDYFPEGTKRVYVSFEISNYPETKPFTRSWFLNGQKVLEREGYLAPPWDGWTWYGAADPEAESAVPVMPGRYTFRVMAGPAVRSAYFQIGSGGAVSAGSKFRDPFMNGKGEGPEMIVLPAGSLTKGSDDTEYGRLPDEGPAHVVDINYKLAVSTHEITRSEWQACVDDGGCNGYMPAPAGPEDGNLPVVSVSFNDVYAYLQWLNNRLGLVPERADRYTLLTEAEWEYAARAAPSADDRRPYSTGESISAQQARFGLGDAAASAPAPAGSYPSNAWGLFDMHGNAAEHVEDCYQPQHAESVTDGRAVLGGACSGRVIKGGSYRDEADRLRVAARRSDGADQRSGDTGFRVARRLNHP